MLKTNSSYTEISEEIEKLTADYKKNEHLRDIYIFHERVLQLFEIVLESEFDKLGVRVKEDYKEKRYLIKSLLFILLKFAGQYQLWDGKKGLSTLNSKKVLYQPDRLLVYMWTSMRKDKALIQFLEVYNFLEKSINICLQSYSVDAAFRLAGFRSFLTVLRIIVTMPLMAGIIIGWLFLLQAGDAVKYFFEIFDNKTPDLAVYPISILVPLVMSYAFILSSGERKQINDIKKKSFRIMVISLFFSLLIGVALIHWLGQQWLHNEIKDLLGPYSNEEKFRIYFFFTWASMAVFIGIFAQIIWSGRGPTEISD